MESYTLRPDTFTLNFHVLFQVRITWWVEEVEHGVAGGTQSGKRVSREHTAEGPARVEVSARVPALVLPETVLVSMDAGKKRIRSPARFKGSVSGAGKRIRTNAD